MPTNLNQHLAEFQPPPSLQAALPAAGVKGRLRTVLDNVRGLWTDNGSAWYPVSESVNVKTFGAVGDGVTDDSTAIQAALTAVTSARGLVYFPAGTYLCNTGIIVPTGVSLVGVSAEGSIIKAGATMNALVSIAHSGATVNSYGLVQNLFIHGNDLAQRALYLGVCTERTFINVRIEHGTKAGLVLNGTQNSTFIRVFIESCGAADSTYGCGLRINHDASNNVFISPEINANDYHGVVICHNDTADEALGVPWDSTLYVVPGDNKFYGGVIERQTATTTSLVYLRGARWTVFDGTSFAFAGATMFEITDEDGGTTQGHTAQNLFNQINVAGSSVTALCSSRGAASATRFSNCQLHCTVTTVFDLADTVGAIKLDANNIMPASPTNFYTTTGSLPRDRLIQIPQTVSGQHLQTWDAGLTAPGISGANAHIGTPAIVGDDNHGYITFTTDGSAPAAGTALLTLTWHYPYYTQPIVLFCGDGGINYSFANLVGTTASVQLVNNTNLGNTTTYHVTYWVWG